MLESLTTQLNQLKRDRGWDEHDFNKFVHFSTEYSRGHDPYATPQQRREMEAIRKALTLYNDINTLPQRVELLREAHDQEVERLLNHPPEMDWKHRHWARLKRDFELSSDNVYADQALQRALHLASNLTLQITRNLDPRGPLRLNPGRKKTPRSNYVSKTITIRGLVSQTSRVYVEGQWLNGEGEQPIKGGMYTVVKIDDGLLELKENAFMAMPRSALTCSPFEHNTMLALTAERHLNYSRRQKDPAPFTSDPGGPKPRAVLESRARQIDWGPTRGIGSTGRWGCLWQQGCSRAS